MTIISTYTLLADSNSAVETWKEVKLRLPYAARPLGVAVAWSTGWYKGDIILYAKHEEAVEKEYADSERTFTLIQDGKAVEHTLGRYIGTARIGPDNTIHVFE